MIQDYQIHQIKFNLTCKINYLTDEYTTQILIAITSLPSRLGNQTEKKPFGVRFKQLLALLSATHGEGLTLSVFC